MYYIIFYTLTSRSENRRAFIVILLLKGISEVQVYVSTKAISVIPSVVHCRKN